MRRLLAPLALALLLCPAALARQEQQQPAAARLVDSFGEVLITDLKARIDNFALELLQAPDAKGYIVAYGARNKFPGWPVRNARDSLQFLLNYRGISAARLAVINGGLRDDNRLELWVVPPGAELNVKPFDVSLLMSGERTPLPFDRFNVLERGDDFAPETDRDSYPDEAYVYAYFAEALRADPGLRGCIIAYTSRRGSLAASRRIAALAKAAVVKSHAIDVRRVVAVGGGRRRYKAVELWLVPPGSPLPKPTPDAFPSRRGRR